MGTVNFEDTLLDADGAGVTGSTGLGIIIRREDDDYLFDFNDSTFKNAGWTTKRESMVEIDATELPGSYELAVTVTGWDDGKYVGYFDYDGSDSGLIQYRTPISLWVFDGTEAKSAVKADTAAILVDTAEMQPKLPTNFIMGSSDQTDKDDEIDAIKAVTDLLPDAGALNDLATLLARLTAARAGYLDELAAANLPADVDGIKAVTDLLPDAGALNDLATLVGRLTAARAGYLDELAAANIPADIDTLLARLTAARAGYLDELAAANLPADVDTLLARLTATRAGYLDELAAANIPADIDQIIVDIAALNNVSAAQVNAEVLDVLNVDTFGEPGQGVHPESASIQYKLSALYKVLTNRVVSDTNGIDMYNRAETIVDQKASHTDAAGVYDRRAVESGP